jgi:hypothetical protein
LAGGCNAATAWRVPVASTSTSKLLLVVLVLGCWRCPRHADCQCCAGLAMLLLVVMALECWCCPRQAGHQGCTVVAMLLLVVTVLGC